MGKVKIKPYFHSYLTGSTVPGCYSKLRIVYPCYPSPGSGAPRRTPLYNCPHTQHRSHCVWTSYLGSARGKPSLKNCKKIIFTHLVTQNKINKIQKRQLGSFLSPGFTCT